jgi:hypothetical protein
MKTVSRILGSTLIATWLLCGPAHAADNTIQVATEQGKPVAQFKLGDSHCVLKDDLVRCTPVSK